MLGKLYGEVDHINNRVVSEEAGFALDLIMADRSSLPPGAVVERSFAIARLAFLHIKENRMDVPYPTRGAAQDANA